MSCNVSRRLRREGLVNSAVKTDNFSLKTVELSWLEHRENVTPATRASSIARSRDFWVMTSQETKKLPEVKVHSKRTSVLNASKAEN